MEEKFIYHDSDSYYATPEGDVYNRSTRQRVGTVDWEDGTVYSDSGERLFQSIYLIQKEEEADAGAPSSGGGASLGDAFRLVPHAVGAVLGSAVIAIPLLFLSDCAKNMGRVYQALLPYRLFIFLGGALGLALLLLWRFTGARRGMRAAAVLGELLLFLSLLWCFGFELGLGAAWAFPMDYLDVGKTRPEFLAGMAECPKAYAFFVKHLQFKQNFALVDFSSGVSGTLKSITGWIKAISQWQNVWVLLRFVLMLVIPLICGPLVIVFALFLFPALCFFVPVAPCCIIVSLVMRLLRSGLR